MEYGILRGTVFDIRHLFILVTCLVHLSPAQQYKWKPGEWSSCICGFNGQGTQSRHVSCMYEEYNGGLNFAEERYCEDLPRPLSQRPCYDECYKSTFIDQYQVTWAAETWGPCQLMPRVKKCARGMGIRYRNVTCVFKSDGRLQNDSVCLSFEQKPTTSESCDLQCKQNCIVTPWQPWANCDTCEKFSRTRIRRVVIPEDHGGKECPPLSEIERCANCSDVYYISVDKWTPCVSMTTIPKNYPSHSLIGHQERAVKCLDSNGATVPYTKCKDHVKLSGKIIADHQSCIIPQDCQVSMWSPWQPINSSCLLETGYTRPGLMRREREVKKLPRGLGKSCPPLVETTPVHGVQDKSRYCPRTKWIQSEWSKCMAVNGGLQCTTGMQHCKVICVEENENGEQKPVSDSECIGPRPAISQLCQADCEWDCTVSLWSQWSDCTVTECDQYARKRRNNQKTGQRYRTRDVLTPPGKNGLQCPHLSETQNCDPEPCYFWNTSSGPCSLRATFGSGENCGAGNKQQTTTCVDKKGMRVQDKLCSEWEARPNNQMYCNIPCRKDCVTSEWGEWSECPDICETGQDVTYRPSMRSRQKTILARAGLGGTECPGERELVENKPCPTVIECAVFIWSADPWGDCQLDVPGSKCGHGKQTRGVHCYNRNNQFVQDEKCTQSVKPSTTKLCEIPCPKDCHLTSWSEWSSCSASCFINKDNIPTKFRRRFILREPDNGGAPCPEVLQEVEQCTELPLCNQMQWKISNWSNCILAPTRYKCGKGLRARDITCIAINGTTHPIEDCLKFLGPMPPVTEACYRSCDNKCLFTDWSEWSHCIQGCSGHQFRSRELAGGVPTPAQCRNIEIYPTYEKQPCQLCESLKPMSTGEWSDCILDSVKHDYITNQPELTSSRGKRTRNTTVLDMGNICGTGRRIKVVACSKHGSGLEPAEKCNGAGYEEEVCMIPCPVDCEMSDWTVWSDCPAKCGAGVQTRYRSIRRLPSAGGRQCPSLGSKSKEIQTRLCHPECVRYVWKTKAWGTCMLHGPQNCGNGTQTRHVRCEAVNRHGFTTGTATEDMCTGQQRPPHMQPCYLYCLEDCVVSEWAPWSSCNKPCNHHDRQVRNREVLRYWNYNNCPEIRETKPCIKNDNCIEYYWEWSSWTTCLINNGMDDCGVGHKERYAICKNHFGENVDNELCEKDAGPVTEPSVVSCEVVCDVDCLVSEWTHWSSCSKSCGLGVSRRVRMIVEQFSRNGRPCPDTLVQEKPCFLRGCYKWTVSQWTNCTSQHGICGHGIQKRNVSCVSEDGSNMDPTKCPPDLSVLIMDTERECTVPCPGECVMSEWTDWNTCYLSREDFVVDKYRSLGVQSRSRAVIAYPKLTNLPCPDKLWEKQHCSADRGMYFAWRTSPWSSEGSRRVWCERSDGLVVMGGCEVDERPPGQLLCEPGCPAESTCNDTNTCVCNPPLFPDYGFRGVLRACVEVNATAQTKAREKDNAKEEGSTSIWMYAVLAAGTVFIIFVALAFYNMSEHFRSGPRPRKTEDEEAAEKLNTGTLDSHRQNGLDRMENCPNVNTHLCAPSPSNTTNRLYENGNTNHLWVRASSKSVRSRVASKFYSMLYLCGCSKHVHDMDTKDTYTAYVDNTDSESFRRIPELEYSDKPTISDQSSVDIELVEMPKKGTKVNGSDSAISMQNSSNDSGRTLESFQCTSPSNYSRPDKRLKKQGSSIDKQRSFDSYTIVEGDGNENDDVPGIIQLEHVSAYSLRSSPKSSTSLESKSNSLCRNVENSDSIDNDNQPLYPHHGSGLFSAHSGLEETTLFDEISKMFPSECRNSTDSSNSSVKNYQPDIERKPSLRGKLQRQKQIVQADIEYAPEDKAGKHIDTLDKDQSSYSDPNYVDLIENDNRSNGEGQEVRISDVKGLKISMSDIEGENCDTELHGSEMDDSKDHIYSDGDLESPLMAESRSDSYDTFKDLVSRQCHKGRKRNKTSRTTTV